MPPVFTGLPPQPEARSKPEPIQETRANMEEAKRHEARYRLAKLLAAKGEVSEPIQHLREAVTLNPTVFEQ